MAQKFPYERAAMALAEAELFGDKLVLEKYGINQSTLWRWRDRASVDAKLHESAILKAKMLMAGWQDAATKTLRVAFNELNTIIPTARNVTDPEQAKALASLIHAISGSIKCVGELKIAAEALNEPTHHLESESTSIYSR